MINLNKVKEKLLKEKKEVELLLEDIKKESEEIIKEPSSAADELADKYEIKEEKHLEEDVLKERLKKIKKALERIEKGIYFFCEKCGKEIEETRLKIDLAANTCRKCYLKK